MADETSEEAVRSMVSKVAKLRCTAVPVMAVANAVRMASAPMLMTVMAIGPLVGPLVGGQILGVAGWRAIFLMLVIVGIATLGALFTLNETLPENRRNHEPLKQAFARYATLLRDPRLLDYAGAGGFFYSGMFAYIAGTPFAYISYYHVPAQLYSLLFAIGVIGIMAANMHNA